MAIHGNCAYGAAGGNGVEVVDVSNPAHLRLWGGNSAVLASGLAISGNNVFVAGGSEGLQVFDPAISPPETPLRLQTTRSGSTLTLTWPATFAGAVLETASQLLPAANWAAESAAPVVAGDQSVVTLEIRAGPRFFRLRNP